MNNKIYIINIMCTQNTHRRWENRRNVFNSRSDGIGGLKKCVFLCSFLYVRLGPWGGNDDGGRGGSYHIGRA